MATQQQCEAVLEAHEQTLMTLANVVGLGVVATDENDHGLAVAVYVGKKVPEALLAPSDIVPATLPLAVADADTQVPIVVIEQGVMSFE